MSKIIPDAELQKLNIILTKLYARQSLGAAFLRGIITGLGSVVGATLVVALIAFMLSKVEFIPIIGSWLSQITEQVINNSSPK